MTSFTHWCKYPYQHTSVIISNCPRANKLTCSRSHPKELKRLDDDGEIRRIQESVSSSFAIKSSHEMLKNWSTFEPFENLNADPTI